MRERTLTIGSLFSGIGGLELGLERAGLGPVVWQVEKDEYCRAALAKHWPHATRYEDVKDVGRANLVPVDVICGGFPCQDISGAGARAGIRGERSGLWFEYARVVRELRPRYVVVENVSALLVRGMGDVLGELAALGYDAWWDCLPASSVGALHRRDRLFLVAYSVSESRRFQPEPESRRGGAPVAGHDGTPQSVADADGVRELQPQGRVTDERRRTGDSGSESREIRDSASAGLPHRASVAMGEPGSVAESERSNWWATEPDVGRVAHGVPRRVDRLRALGNAVVPQVAEIVGRVVLALEAQRGAA